VEPEEGILQNLNEGKDLGRERLRKPRSHSSTFTGGRVNNSPPNLSEEKDPGRIAKRVALQGDGTPEKWLNGSDYC